MKKFILIIWVVLFTLFQATAQQQTNSLASSNYTLHKGSTFITDSPSFNLSHNPQHSEPEKDYNYYLKKKKNNLTAGLVTLGSGLLLSGIALITSSNSKSFDDDATAGVLFIAGAASGIASIPLMIMSHVYNHKAKLMLSEQKTGFGVPASVSKDIVGITLRIPLGK